MTAYVHRPTTVRAVQFTGTNHAEVIAFARSRHVGARRSPTSPLHDGVALYTLRRATGTITESVLAPGDWLVHHPTGMPLQHWTDDEFTRSYQEKT